MLNYLSAEWYKLRRKKSLYIAVGLILLGESTLLLVDWDIHDLAQTLLSFLKVMLPMGLFLAPAFAITAFDDQHGRGTLKNEVVFGVPRSRIYLGKLLAALTAGTLAAAVIVAWHLVITSLLCGVEAVAAQVWQVLPTIVCMWMTWLAAGAFTFFLTVVLKTAAVATAVVYLTTFIGLPLCMAGYDGPSVFLTWFSRLFYAAPCRALTSWDPLPLYAFLGATAALCLGWVAGTSALGLALFRRQEVK